MLCLNKTLKYLLQIHTFMEIKMHLYEYFNAQHCNLFPFKRHYTWSYFKNLSNNKLYLKFNFDGKYIIVYCVCLQKHRQIKRSRGLILPILYCKISFIAFRVGCFEDNFKEVLYRDKWPFGIMVKEFTKKKLNNATPKTHSLVAANVPCIPIIPSNCPITNNFLFTFIILRALQPLFHHL